MLEQPTITPITVAQEFAELELFAAEIWREHYVSIIGEAKVEYMLKTFQSALALEKQQREGMEFFWIQSAGDRAGYLAFKREPKSAYLFVSKFYVHQAFRSKGYGNWAMNKLKDLAFEYQLDGLELTVNRHNASAIAFYKREGLKHLRDQCIDIGGGFFMDDYVMRFVSRVK
jgi:diamine N-acetyltransferase